MQGLVDNLPLLLDAALQLITGLAEGLIAAIPVIIEALPQIITGIVTFLVGAIPQIIEAGIQLLTALIGALPQIITAIVAALPQIIGAIVSAIGGAIPQLVQAGIQLLTALVRALPQIISTIVAAIPQIITGIVSAVGQGVWQMVEAGKNLVYGLWNGIQSLAGWLWDSVSNWASGIWDSITGFFGIHSPSRKMAWAGRMLVEGLAGSIRTDGNKAVTAATGLARDTMNAFANLEDGLAVPIETVADLQVPAVDLTPQPIAINRDTSGGADSERVDVASIVDATAKRILSSLDISVTLSDGTLVGKLAPALDKQLARLDRRQTVMAGGY